MADGGFVEWRIMCILLTYSTDPKKGNAKHKQESAKRNAKARIPLIEKRALLSVNRKRAK